MLRRTLALAAVALTPAAATAQHADGLRVGAVPRAHAADSAPPARARPRDAEALRVITGLAGWAAGAYAGGVLGYEIRARRGEWDGVEEALLGAWAGGLAGAALGSAFPDFGHPCDEGRRLGRAFAGSAVGSAVGLIGLVADAWVLVTVPVGAVIGSVAGASGCRPATAR